MSAPIVHLAGPTASGKSSLAERLCEHFDVELISVDSALVYRGMDIGSAKPDLTTQRRCRYHLIDLIDVEQSYSAAQFVEDAQRLVRQIHGRGRIPVLVGGTMLYFRALTVGLSELPSSDPAIRAELTEQLHAHGLAALHAQLCQLDPEAGARIHQNDPQRTLRALEVIRQTGASLSSQQNQWRREAQVDSSLLRFALYPEREVLHRHIAQRFSEMLAQGFVAEVAALMTRPTLTAEHASMRCVGYRQAWQHLSGEFDLAELERRGVIATRQLAKRQYTWIRSDPQLKQLSGTKEQNFDEICRALVAYTSEPDNIAVNESETLQF